MLRSQLRNTSARVLGMRVEGLGGPSLMVSTMMAMQRSHTLEQRQSEPEWVLSSTDTVPPLGG
jgi:hypothetical protein